LSWAKSLIFIERYSMMPRSRALAMMELAKYASIISGKRVKAVNFKVPPGSFMVPVSSPG
jgi:hypothetical protein